MDDGSSKVEAAAESRNGVASAPDAADLAALLAWFKANRPALDALVRHEAAMRVESCTRALAQVLTQHQCELKAVMPPHDAGATAAPEFQVRPKA